MRLQKVPIIGPTGLISLRSEIDQSLWCALFRLKLVYPNQLASRGELGPLSLRHEKGPLDVKWASQAWDGSCQV